MTNSESHEQSTFSGLTLDQLLPIPKSYTEFYRWNQVGLKLSLRADVDCALGIITCLDKSIVIISREFNWKRLRNNMEAIANLSHVARELHRTPARSTNERDGRRLKRADFDLQTLLAGIKDRAGIGTVLGHVANQAFWIQYVSIRDYLVQNCRDIDTGGLISQVCRELHWPLLRTTEELEQLKFVDFVLALRCAAANELRSDKLQI